MILFLALPALAGEVDTWVGGAVSAGVGLASTGGELAVAVPLQAELDARAGSDHWYARLDADVRAQPIDNPDVLVQPYPVEWAMAQLGAGEDPYRLRLGITNPNVTLEDWDEWNNYLPTFSMFFNGASPGRILGGEVGLHRPDGTEVFAWGGADLDFYGFPPLNADTFTPTFGVGVSTEQDSWGTWSGVASYPTEGYHGLFVALESYHLDPVWLTLDGGVGVSGGAPFLGGQLLVNVFPEATVAPVLRVEAAFDPDDDALGGAAYGVYDGTTSVGVRVAPIEPLLLMAEGKLMFEGDQTVPGLYLQAHLLRWEPPTYDVVEPED